MHCGVYVWWFPEELPHAGINLEEDGEGGEGMPRREVPIFQVSVGDFTRGPIQAQWVPKREAWCAGFRSFCPLWDAFDCPSDCLTVSCSLVPHPTTSIPWPPDSLGRLFPLGLHGDFRDPCWGSRWPPSLPCPLEAVGHSSHAEALAMVNSAGWDDFEQDGGTGGYSEQARVRAERLLKLTLNGHGLLSHLVCLFAISERGGNFAFRALSPVIPGIGDPDPPPGESQKEKDGIQRKREGEGNDVRESVRFDGDSQPLTSQFAELERTGIQCNEGGEGQFASPPHPSETSLTAGAVHEELELPPCEDNKRDEEIDQQSFNNLPDQTEQTGHSSFSPSPSLSEIKQLPAVGETSSGETPSASVALPGPTANEQLRKASVLSTLSAQALLPPTKAGALDESPLVVTLPQRGNPQDPTIPPPTEGRDTASHPHPFGTLHVHVHLPAGLSLVSKRPSTGPLLCETRSQREDGTAGLHLNQDHCPSAEQDLHTQPQSGRQAVPLEVHPSESGGEGVDVQFASTGDVSQVPSFRDDEGVPNVATEPERRERNSHRDLMEMEVRQEESQAGLPSSPYRTVSFCHDERQNETNPYPEEERLSQEAHSNSKREDIPPPSPSSGTEPNSALTASKYTSDSRPPPKEGEPPPLENCRRSSSSSIVPPLDLSSLLAKRAAPQRQSSQGQNAPPQKGSKQEADRDASRSPSENRSGGGQSNRSEKTKEGKGEVEAPSEETRGNKEQSDPSARSTAKSKLKAAAVAGRLSGKKSAKATDTEKETTGKKAPAKTKKKKKPKHKDGSCSQQ
uniref:Uncharacterized protein n=1 Tax=Chromera velia CCMP2878 TaxID=1169474 RepID=A0A0K6S8V8_9ALVE|eukprot:Cvel_6160.t2-p1 / transcript=Cvel_6160.t2 / gene=Cvel_6160 / organism=Chromera_velia_CCMP2878 / gene_product=MORN repeat-containing protein 3, putative / transcript_product=MORN repeat-containing protein 3, putative / location=Cvel_scaffold298:30811-33698(-) / protein_length=793 / sequence_SO=supercontig / SO=protein_coding / is_pseudo=false